MFKIQLLLGQLVFEFGNLAVGERILYSDGDLLGDVREQFRVLLSEGVLDLACYMRVVPSTLGRGRPEEYCIRPQAVIVCMFESVGRETSSDPDDLSQRQGTEK